MSFASANDALVGRTLGEFVLRERIGEGGFGAVYRAIQPALDREAVIKVLHANQNRSKAAQERFLREAKLASRLDHPYAAHVYAFGAEADGQIWIAMELVRGTPLDQVLKLQGPMPLERFIPLLERICEVVHTAHESGIVHRDLKPANVMMLARAGRLLPKLLDFGIAKGIAADRIGTDETLDGSSDPTAATANVPALRVENLTVRGAVMGSPPYMAPEQWIDAGQVDARTDLYALGIMTYECLTGRPPFTGTTLTAIATAHACQVPPTLGAQFPSALDRVIAKALAKEPGDRFPDALALAAALRSASGIATEIEPLPGLEAALRDASMTGMPQPIAESIAAFEASRNSYQARDALTLVGRTLARYLGLLCLACRSRVAADDAASELIRTLYRRSLTDKEWLELATEITRPWISRREAFSIPELVGVFHDASVVQHLEALTAIRDTEVANEDGVLALLDVGVAHASRLLEALAFLSDYPLVVTSAGNHAERWMGVRRTQRATTAVRGKVLSAGIAALLDRDGAPVLTLSPLLQIAAPTPGAPLDLFLFEGRDRRGAKLVALPSGFEHHDDEVWNWVRAQLTVSLDDTATAVVEERPPYRGLSAFSAEDGAMFVGREKEVDAFTNRLKLQPLLAVVGPSGAGKSSFVHAGIVPALGWRTVVLRPGPSPLGALTARLEHAGIAAVPEWSTGEGRPSARLPVVASLREVLAGDREALGHLLRADAVQRGPLLVVVDQLEEMFTLCSDEGERKIFSESLAAAARSVDDPVRVVFTLRDDFLVRTEQVPALRNRMSQGLQIVTVPAAEDLLRIVIEPARRVGYELESGLAAEMVKAVADQPGALALLSFTASKLWESRDRHFKQLTRSAYATLGGVGGALAQHAERTLAGMPPEERALTREAFRNLVTTQNTRAVLARRELRQLLGNDAHADGVIENLVAARLVVASENESGDETIEVIHEALLVTWPRLVEWRREDVEGTRFREQLRGAAKQWDDRARAKGLLWRGDALGELTRWRGRHTGPLTDIEAAFTDASLADVARSRRTVRILLAVAFAVLGAVVIGLIVFNTRVAGQRRRAEAAARELHDNLQRTDEDQGRRYVLADDPLRALAYLAKARELGAHGRDHDLLVAQSIQRSSGELLEVHHTGPVRGVRFSKDGTRFLTAGFDGYARIWDARTGSKLLELAHRTGVFRVELDDTRVLTASTDGTARLWDAATGTELHVFSGAARCADLGPGGDLVLTADAGAVVGWNASDGGRRFVTPVEQIDSCAISRDATLVAVGSATGAAVILDSKTGAVVHQLGGSGAGRRIDAIAFSPDGTQIATGSSDGVVVLWSAVSGTNTVALGHHGAVLAIDYSSQSDRLVVASDDGTATIWDAHSGTRILVLAGHQAAVNRAVFSPDGKSVVTISNDTTAALWDATTGEVQSRFRAHRDGVSDVAFDASGSRIVTGGEDGLAIVWKAAPQERVTLLSGHRGEVRNARFSPSGTRVVTAGEDLTARVWSATGEQLLELRGHTRTLTDVAFSPDERTIATSSADGTLRIWDAATGALQRTLEAASPTAFGGDVQLAWSPDGTTIATASHDGWLRAWNTATWESRFSLRGHGDAGIYSVAFMPDGRSMMTAGGDLTTRVWDLAGTLLSVRPDPDTPIGAAIEPSGERVLSVELRSRATLWTVATGIIGPTLTGHNGMITDAQWSPDGAFAVTASVDGTARIWDTKSGDDLVIIASPHGANASSFSRDGRRVLISGVDGRATIHTLPTYDGSEEDLRRLLACRVPYEVKDERLVPRERQCN